MRDETAERGRLTILLAGHCGQQHLSSLIESHGDDADVPGQPQAIAANFGVLAGYTGTD
jgi:hypothetical protein